MTLYLAYTRAASYKHMILELKYPDECCTCCRLISVQRSWQRDMSSSAGSQDELAAMALTALQADILQYCNVLKVECSSVRRILTSPTSKTLRSWVTLFDHGIIDTLSGWASTLKHFRWVFHIPAQHDNHRVCVCVCRGAARESYMMDPSMLSSSICWKHFLWQILIVSPSVSPYRWMYLISMLESCTCCQTTPVRTTMSIMTLTTV